MNPRLLHSPLTGQVYIVTRYTDHAPKDGRPGYVTAHTKYDVTEEFRALARTLATPSQDDAERSRAAGAGQEVQS